MKACFFYIFVFISFTFIKAQIESVTFNSSNLPIFVINTHGQRIPDEPKIEVDLGIIYNGEGIRNKITDPFNEFNGKIAIEIRGSSSQMFPKKQYGFETIDSTGEDKDVSLLGFPTESDWILYAPYSDKSLIRNVLAYKLANNIGRYASRSRLCELVLNDEYMGVYVLLEKIKRNKDRVDISKLTEADTTGDNLTGGYILKIDKKDGGYNSGWYSDYRPYSNAWQTIYIQYHYPKPESILDVQKKYIKSIVDSFETTMNSPEFADTLKGYTSFIDVESFVDYFILSELSRNVDAFRLSFFFYKDKNSKDKKIKAGPLWDLNLGFGNSDYYNASSTEGWQINYLTTDPTFLQSDYYQVPFWWKKLFSDKEFKNKIKLRWKEFRENELSIPNIMAIIDSITILLSESEERNFERWDILDEYIWPNAYVGGSYENEISYLKNWIINRLNWMDEELDFIDDVSEKGKPVANNYYLFQNYPNPFNPSTMIKYKIPESGLVTIKVYDALGREIATLVNEEKPVGSYEIKFDGSNLSSGVYFYRLNFDSFISIKKMILLK
ncbi:CotH kinase family protein [bacterium BMS3Abin03]|nr:CotH kinase family protein [bacterium BMS3Abin03]MCG6960089.1 CotH kinase family protein [bacterium BMS3Abin03]